MNAPLTNLVSSLQSIVSRLPQVPPSYPKKVPDTVMTHEDEAEVFTVPLVCPDF